MDLELADYRRSAEVLKRQVEEKEVRQREQEQLLASHLQQLELAKKEIGEYTVEVHNDLSSPGIRECSTAVQPT